MQARLLEAQEELARAEVTARPAAAWCTRPSPAAARWWACEIDPAAIDPDDAEGLADLVLAAIRDANRAARRAAGRRRWAPLAEGLGGMGGGLGLPGL